MASAMSSRVSASVPSRSKMTASNHAPLGSRSARGAWILLLAADAHSTLHVVYPRRAAGATALPGGTMRSDAGSDDAGGAA